MRQLAQDGVLDGRQLREGLRLLRAHADRSAWRAFADKMLLTLGIGLIVAGAVFFFAANWDAVGKGARIGLAVLSHVVAVLAAARIGLHRPTGRAAAAGAALLIGPALLTYGQAYQTGADAWELFFGWALLAVPFAVVVRGSALWAVVLVLARASAFLYAEQHRLSLYSADPSLAVFLVAALVDIGAVTLARRVADRPRAPLLFLLLGVSTLAPVLAGIVTGELPLSPLALVVLVVGIGIHVAELRRAVREGRPEEAALVGLSACLHLGLFGARIVFKELRPELAGFWFGGLLLAEATGLAFLLGKALAARRGRSAP